MAPGHHGSLQRSLLSVSGPDHGWETGRDLYRDACVSVFLLLHVLACIDGTKICGSASRLHCGEQRDLTPARISALYRSVASWSQAQSFSRSPSVITMGQCHC